MPVLFTDGAGIRVVPTIKDDIQEMTNYYYDTMQDKGDATSAWVSIYELMQLIGDNKGANGIRIFYGRHKNDTVINGINNKDYHNLILVTTKDSVNPDNPTSENSVNLLLDNVSAVSYTGNGADNIPTKPPHGDAGRVQF